MDSTKALIAAAGTLAILGGGSLLLGETAPLEYVEVSKEVITEDAPVWQFTFQNDKTGELTTQEVTKEEYDAWLQGSMTIKDYPQPQLEGHTWIEATGEKRSLFTTQRTLQKGEYVKLIEETATTTAVYKYNDGTKEELTSIKP